MGRSSRWWAPLLSALALGGWSSSSEAAWVETHLKSQIATVDVERSGSAVVTEELLVGVRGGPLRAFDVAGADTDAVVLEGATATPIVKYGVPAPIPLTLLRQDDGTLHIEIQREKGLYTGTYRFRFQYRTDLLGRDHLRRRGAGAEVEWIGPRFEDGIDVAKVTFRLPGGSNPTLMNDPAALDDNATGSAFVASTHAEGGKTEIELVRPHVARGEPAVWRVAADPKAFDGLEPPANAASAERAERVIAIERPAERAVWVLAAIAAAIAYSILVSLKWVLFGADCRAAGAEPRAFLRLPIGLRAALAGVLLSGAGLLFATGDHPNAGALLLVGAMALAALGNPRALPAPRGPGHWLALNESDAFSSLRKRRRGRFFDIGAREGFVLFSLSTAGFVGGAAWLASRSPYHALALLAGSASLLPLFATGRAASLPVHRARQSERFLRRAQRGLARRGLRALPWARIPQGCPDPDELRLLLRLPRALDGFSALELGIDYQPSIAGFWAQPFVLVRVREASAAYEALKNVVRWQRGRRSDERVAVLNPTLPDVASSVALVRELSRQLGDRDSESSTSARKTSGTSSVTEKLKIASPAHAT
jgi:hypothetical protein